jgi:hypothetical protein
MRTPKSTRGIEVVDSNLGGFGAPCSFLPEPEALRNKTVLDVSERLRRSPEIVGGTAAVGATPASTAELLPARVRPLTVATNVAPDATTPPPATVPKKRSGIKIAIGVGAGVVGLVALTRALGR